MVNGNLKKISYIIHKIVSYIQNKSYKIIYLNDQQKKYVKEKNIQKLVFLPNYPEVEKFNKVKHVDSKKLRITYAGFVRDAKSFENLIMATGNMKNINVSIHGSGIAYDSVKKMANKYNNINVTGAFKHEDIIEFYNQTDLIYVVYDSNNINCYTAFPTKFFEALSIGCPVIVEKNSLMGEFVKKYNIGFGINGSDISSLKKVINEIENNKECLKIKSKNIRAIAKQYMWEEIVKKLDEIYN